MRHQLKDYQKQTHEFEKQFQTHQAQSEKLRNIRVKSKL